jgi:hypothetical protein
MEEMIEEIVEFPIQTTFNEDDMRIVEGGEEEDGNEDN